MLWLNYLKQSGEAYDDLKKYLDGLKQNYLDGIMHAKTMDEVNQIKGQVNCVVAFQLAVTQEERAQRERIQRADHAARERGTANTPG